MTDTFGDGYRIPSTCICPFDCSVGLIVSISCVYLPKLGFGLDHGVEVLWTKRRILPCSVLDGLYPVRKILQWLPVQQEGQRDEIGGVAHERWCTWTLCVVLKNIFGCISAFQIKGPKCFFSENCWFGQKLFLIASRAFCAAPHTLCHASATHFASGMEIRQRLHLLAFSVCSSMSP